LAYEDVILATTGLVSYWRLNENSGAVAADSKGADPGAYVGTPTYQQVGPIRQTADTDAILLDAAGDYLSITRSAAMDSVVFPPCSVEMWVKRTRTNVTEQLFMKGDGELTARFEGAPGTIAVRAQNVGILATSSIGIADTLWHHIVITSTVVAGATGSAAIYIDGANSTTAVSTRNFTAAATDLFFGADNLGATGFIGTLDEIAVYNTVLTQPTIQAHTRASIPASTGGATRTIRRPRRGSRIF
jgi:hypothetical protein